MRASQNGKKDIVKLLIQKGADINAVATGGLSALMLAADENFKDIVEILIAYGADVNGKQDIDGLTALTSAAFFDNNAR
jgi:ankyrin repeat protein